MYKSNEGSALIIVLLIMTFVTVLAVSVIKITKSEDTMSKMYNDKNSAYYVAESGIEKYLAVLKSNLNSYLTGSSFREGLLSSGVNTTGIESMVQSYISDRYTELNDSIGDGRDLLNSDGSSKKHFEVNASSPNVSVSGAGTNNFICKITIPIESKGYDGNISSTIKSKQLVEFSIESSGGTGSPPANDYPWVDIYCQNMLNIISDPEDTSDVNLNGSYASTGGNILISTNNSVDFNGSYVFNGNTAIRAGKNINFFSSAIVQNGNLILDASKVSGSYTVNSSNLFTRQKNNIANAADKTWNSELSSKVSILLTPGFKNIKSDFKIRELVPETSLESKSGNIRGMKYYCFYDKDHNITGIKNNGSYTIIMCNDGAVIEGSFNFNGLIYCNGTLKINGSANISGIIIAKNIDVFGSLTTEYDIPNPRNDKYTDIKTTLKEFTQGETSTPTINVGNISYKATEWNVE